MGILSSLAKAFKHTGKIADSTVSQTSKQLDPDTVPKAKPVLRAEDVALKQTSGRPSTAQDVRTEDISVQEAQRNIKRVAPQTPPEKTSFENVRTAGFNQVALGQFTARDIFRYVRGKGMGAVDMVSSSVIINRSAIETDKARRIAINALSKPQDVFSAWQTVLSHNLLVSLRKTAVSDTAQGLAATKVATGEHVAVLPFKKVASDIDKVFKELDTISTKGELTTKDLQKAATLRKDLQDLSKSLSKGSDNISLRRDLIRRVEDLPDTTDLHRRVQSRLEEVSLRVAQKKSQKANKAEIKELERLRETRKVLSALPRSSDLNEVYTGAGILTPDEFNRYLKLDADSQVNFIKESLAKQGLSIEDLKDALKQQDIVKQINGQASLDKVATPLVERFKRRFFQVFYSSLLSNPVTLLRAISSNVALVGTTHLERVTSIPIGMLRRQFTSDKALGRSFVEVTAGVRGSFELPEAIIKDTLGVLRKPTVFAGTTEEAAESINISAHLSSTLDGYTDFLTLLKKMEDAEDLYGAQSKVPVPATTPPEAMNTRLGRAFFPLIDSTLNLPIQALGGIDNVFKIINMSVERRTLAERNYLTNINKGVDPDLAMAQKVQDLEGFNPEIERRALSLAHENTMNTQLEKGSFSGHLEQFSRRFGVVQWVMPFVKVSSNSFKGFVVRSPFAPMHKSFKEAVAAGGVRKDDAISRMTMGSLALGGAAMLAHSGVLTGDGPREPNARKAWLDSGALPQSVVFNTSLFNSWGLNEGQVSQGVSEGWIKRVGDKTYVSYVGLEPFSTAMRIASNLSEIQKYAEDEDGFLELVGASIFTIFGSILDSTSMKGAVDFFSATKDPTRFGESFTKNAITALIPLGGGLNYTRKIIDPIRRENAHRDPSMSSAENAFWDLYAAYANKLPWVSLGNDAKLNDFGEPVTISTAGVFPWGVSTPETDAYAVAEHNLNYPIAPISKRVRGITLTPKQHNRLKGIVGKEVFIEGRSKRDYLNAIVTLPEFNLITKDRQISWLKSVSSDFNKMGRILLYNEDLSLQSQVFRMELLKSL